MVGFNNVGSTLSKHDDGNVGVAWNSSSFAACVSSGTTVLTTGKDRQGGCIYNS